MKNCGQFKRLKRLKRPTARPFKVLCDVLKNPVDSQIRLRFEGLLANWTFTSSSSIPVALDAIQAVIVSAWNGCRVVEKMLTDAASQRLLNVCRGHVPSKRHGQGRTVMAVLLRWKLSQQLHVYIWRPNDEMPKIFSTLTYTPPSGQCMNF